VQQPAVPSLDTAAYGARSFQGIPAVARVGSRLWTVWYGDTRVPWVGEAPGNFLILRYSDDGGSRWSREFFLVPARPATDRAFDPQLWTAPDGKLWVLYSQSGNGKTYDGQFGVWAAVIANPLEAAPRFEPGFWLADGIPGSPFRHEGGWSLPIDLWSSPAPRFPARAGKFVYRLDWQNRKVAKLTKLPTGTGANFDETSVVERRGGGLFAQWRTSNGVQQSTASTSLSWSTPRLFSTFLTAWARHALVRSPSGRLVMVFNMADSAGGSRRTKMTVALSDDDGATWPYWHTFDTRDQISYPDVDFDENGDILIVYDRERAASRQIALARIRENSIVQGPPSVVTKTVAGLP
jgi:hypothetical protein